MLKEITVLTGIRGGGKTALGKILLLALNNSDKVRFVDMSDAVKYFLARPQSEIGKQLQPYRQTMDDGGLVTDGRLIYLMLMEYLATMDRDQRRHTEHLILAGGMRTENEAKCFLGCKVPVTVIHITGNENDINVGIQRRKDAGEFRADSMSPEKLQRFWYDYKKHTIPALKLCPNYHAISFHLSMRAKVIVCIDVMPLPAPVKTRMKRRIKSGNHNACIAIEALDHPKTKANQARPAHSASPPQNNLVSEFAGVSPSNPFSGAMHGQFTRPS